jgi:hypothetical protein
MIASDFLLITLLGVSMVFAKWSGGTITGLRSGESRI